MRELDNVCIASKQIGDEWFNIDPVRFAIVPDSQGTANEAIAVAVNQLAQVFRYSADIEQRYEAAEELFDFHAQAMVLWPIGLMIPGSVFGDENKFGTFTFWIAEAAPVFAELREFLASDSRAHSGKNNAATITKNTNLIWRSLAAIRFATTGQLNTLDDFCNDHFEAMAEVVRPAGIWADWLPIWAHNAPRYTAKYLAKVKQMPLFGLGIKKRNSLTSKGPRLTEVSVLHPHLQWLNDSYEAWLDELDLILKRHPRIGKALLSDYFVTLSEESTASSSVAFVRKNMQGLLTFATTWSPKSGRVLALTKIVEYGKWLSDRTRGDDGKSSIEFTLYESDVRTFVRQQSTTKRSSNADVSARPMPMRYHLQLKEIITENDFAWPKSITYNDVNGIPSYYIQRYNEVTRAYEQIFCPVVPRLLLLMLDIPYRNIQARRLDSGEGDDERWNPRTQLWEPNDGAHGGHWSQTHAKNPRRGAIRRIPTSDGSSLTGFWGNSNKTQDRNTLFDETSGLEIAWEHIPALQNLAEMREWQEEYNPVSGPLAHKDLPPGIFSDDPTESVRALLPDRFYLFRYPKNPGPHGNEAPPTYFRVLQFFRDALDELERRLNAELGDEDQKFKFITSRYESGRAKGVIFTLHGMRSATLTGLHLAGVPIEVLSKMVAGHASILMTLKYTKFDALHVNQILTKARLTMVAQASTEFVNSLSKVSFEQAVKMTAWLSDDGVKQTKNLYEEPSAWSRLEIGICPNGSTLCHVGGEALVKRNDKGLDKSVYGPVPGGPRNCVRCRFLVTGLPFLIPLWTHSIAICARADRLAHEASTAESELASLKSQRRELANKKIPVTIDLRDKITIREEFWLTTIESRDRALMDLHATMALIEKVRAISKVNLPIDNDGLLPMLIGADEIPEVIGRESTRFEISDAVVQASRIFPSLRSAEMEQERNEFLNVICYMNGYVPITVAPLSKEEKKLAADAMAEMLLIEIGAQETENLISGKRTLSDFSARERFEEACRRAIGAPISKLSPLSHPSSLDIDRNTQKPPVQTITL